MITRRNWKPLYIIFYLLLKNSNRITDFKKKLRLNMLFDLNVNRTGSLNEDLQK